MSGPIFLGGESSGIGAEVVVTGETADAPGPP